MMNKRNKLFHIGIFRKSLRITWGLIIQLIFLADLYAQPIVLHPENSHYFEYKGSPAILISSAEHYGAVINGAFDYKKYLMTLHKDGMNYTRIFTGSYFEVPGAFGIKYNTLAPKPENLIVPWVQVNEKGIFPEEDKFDLDKWNLTFFKRLRDFVQEADRLDIIVEITFFSSNYSDKMWARNPFNADNSVNGLPSINRKDVNTLKNGKILHYQKELVKKIVVELNEFNNVIYEIQNEPWSDNPMVGISFNKTLIPGKNKEEGMSKLASIESVNWQAAIAKQIVDVERNLPKTHLIAQNYCNLYHPLANIVPSISILNFHYAWAEASYLNYGWERPVSFDESGFSEKSGMGDTTYLRQAWEFILAGGAVFNNLDYSFFCGSEDGTKENKAPGGGSTGLRKQLYFLQCFMKAFDFIKMKPDFQVVYHAPGMRAQALSENGKQYAIVFTEITNNWVKLDLPKGKYHYAFISPFTGNELLQGTFKSKGNATQWKLPPEIQHMVALKIVKQ